MGLIKRRTPRTGVVVASDGTGDYYQLQEAIDAAPSTGWAISLKRGDYLGGVDANKPNLNIIGEGDVLTRIRAAAGTRNLAITADNVTVQGLLIDGENGAVPTSSVGVYVTGNKAKLLGVKVIDTNSHAVDVVGADFHAQRCHLEHRHTNPLGTAGYVFKGFYVHSSAALRPRIIDSYIRGFSQAIGLWYGVAYGLVRGCTLLDNYGYEAAGTPRSAIEDYGQLVAGHGYNRWEGNYVDGSTSYCIEIAQGVLGSQYVNNVLRNPGAVSGLGGCFAIVGQASQETRDILFAENDCTGSAVHSASNGIDGLVYDIRILNNTFRDYTFASTGGPIYIGGLSGPAGIRVDGNHFRNCLYGIRTETGVGDGCIITRNIMRAMLGPNCIRLNNGGYHVVSENDIEIVAGVSGAAVIANAGNGHRLARNRIRAALGSAIDLRTADNRVTENDLENSNLGNTGVIQVDGAAALRNLLERNAVRSVTNRRTIVFSNGADYNRAEKNTLTSTIGSDGYYESAAGTHNTNRNHNGTVTKNETPKNLGTQTIGTSQIAIAHGLGYTPTEVTWTMTSDGRIWRSAASDGTNVYLTGDAAGRTAEVLVR